MNPEELSQDAYNRNVDALRASARVLQALATNDQERIQSIQSIQRTEEQYRESHERVVQDVIVDAREQRSDIDRLLLLEEIRHERQQQAPESVQAPRPR